MRNSIFRVSVIAIATLAAAVMLVAQDETVIVPGPDVMAAGTPMLPNMTVVAMAPQAATIGTYDFVAAQAGMEGKVVKDKPYSAEGVTETKRVLADGTTITRESQSKIYRDSKGRTRREMTLAAIGPLAAEGEPPTTVTISDPATGRVMITHTASQTTETVAMAGSSKREVHVVRVEGEGGTRTGEFQAVVPAPGQEGRQGNAVWIQKGGPDGDAIRTHDFTAVTNQLNAAGEGEATEEDLGEKVIEGLVAKGTKTTTVIPEGEIGNDRDITITHERWYSDELETLVRSETNDPMTGTVTYRLTNINRAEPDPSLFEMPEDMNGEARRTIERRRRVITTVEKKSR